MGADLSIPVEKSQVQKAQNQLFREYQETSTVDSMRQELENWDSVLVQCATQTVNMLTCGQNM